MRSFGFAIVGSVALMLVACGGSSGEPMPAPNPQLASLVQEGPSAECPAGGTRILTGVDADGDGKVDSAEAKSSQVVCNGSNGKDGIAPAAAPLMNVDVEPAGANCMTGGVKIMQGKDTDGDGKLGAPEVTTTKFVCNGDRAASAASPVVNVYVEPVITTTGTTAFTALEAKLTAPGKGKII